MLELALLLLASCGAAGPTSQVLATPTPQVQKFDCVVSGPPGGPFQFDSTPVGILNTLGSTVEYTISCDDIWVTWEVETIGTIAAGSTLQIGLAIVPSLAPIGSGLHGCSVSVQLPALRTVLATVDVVLDVVPSETGWTTFSPSVDTRTVYVSSSGSPGGGAGDGTLEKPFASVDEAYGAVRDGYPDWVLVRRGDTFPDFTSFTWWKKGGRSSNEPMVIATYGVGPRPVFHCSDGKGIGIESGVSKGYLAILDLDLYAHHRDPHNAAYDPSRTADGSYGLYVAGGYTSLLVEDCRFRFFLSDAIVNSGSSGGSKDISIRRCQIENSYTTSGHCNGLYASAVRNLLIEDSYFDHNGWNEDNPDATMVALSHNLYLFECQSVVVRDNLFSRGCALGCKVASDHGESFGGLVVEDNLFLGNGYGLGLNFSNSWADYAHIDYVIRRNVITELERFANVYAILITSSRRGRLEDNLVLNAGTPGVALHISGVQDGLAVLRNVTHGTGATSLRVEASSLPGVTMTDNVEQIAAAECVDPSRTVAGYLASIGFVGGVSDYLAAMSAQTKGTWDESLCAAKISDYLRAGFMRQR